jgi:hypothetical protein
MMPDQVAGPPGNRFAAATMRVSMQCSVFGEDIVTLFDPVTATLVCMHTLDKKLFIGTRAAVAVAVCRSARLLMTIIALLHAHSETSQVSSRQNSLSRHCHAHASH